MKGKGPFLFYGIQVLAAWILSWFLPHYFFIVISYATIGTGLVAFFAALYLSELKQESIGQLYQALAASNLRSVDQVLFNEAALEKIRTIRRMFLLSNILKFLGAGAGLYLSTEKSPVFIPEDAARLAFLCALLSAILFARMWFEVSSSERALIDVKTQTMLDEKAKEFLAHSSTAAAYDFDADPAVQSFHAAAHATSMKDLH